MALTREQARELRSLMHTWNKASNEVGEILRGATVSGAGLDMKVMRSAMDRRSEIEELVKAFWSRGAVA
jgi:hypothetical protein